MKNNYRLISILMLTGCSMIWGTSFTAQVFGMEIIGPFSFIGVRYCIAAIFLTPLVLFFDLRHKKKNDFDKNIEYSWKKCLKSGVICGTALFTATSLQQIGLLFTPTGKTAFITTLYVLIVPLIGIIRGKFPSKIIVTAIITATVGLYLISIKDNFTFAMGDTIILVGAIVWAIHITCCGIFSANFDPIKLSVLQFSTVSVLGIAAMLIFERPDFMDIIISWKPIVYAGVLGTGVAYTLQMMGQKNIPETIASLILSLESVFASIFGFLILNERMTQRELIGCAILFISVITAQVYEISGNSKK